MAFCRRGIGLAWEPYRRDNRVTLASLVDCSKDFTAIRCMPLRVVVVCSTFIQTLASTLPFLLVANALLLGKHTHTHTHTPVAETVVIRTSIRRPAVKS